MTVNELALIMIREQGEANDDADYVTTVETWINDALDEFASAHDWRFLRSTGSFNTVDGTDEYDLATNVREIRKMRFQETNEEIQYIDSPRLYQRYEDFEQESKPRFWYWKESESAASPLLTIGLVPIPDAVYTIEYLAIIHPVFETLTSGVLPFQREMLIAIKDRVRSYILSDDKDYIGSNIALQRFYGKVEQLIQRENAPKAGAARLQVSDLSGANDRRLVRLDPNRFS